MQFEDAVKLVSHITSEGHSPFYRDLYGFKQGDPALSIQSKDEWSKLPFLTKTDLLARNLVDRSFIPLKEIDHLRVSSGTSGKGVLFSPRTHVRNMEYRLAYHTFDNAFMAYTTPLMPHWHEIFQREHGGSPVVISYDPKNPMASVRLAIDAGVDGMSVFIFHISTIGEEMKKLQYADKIIFIEVTGELCTRAQYEYIRTTFPNALILQSYNSSEVEDAHIGMPCRPMSESEPLAVYHQKESHYLELIDRETGALIEPTKGAEGDLIISAYPQNPAAFPLVRFRIGDTVKVVETRCPHGTWSFTVLGRTELDFLKIPGGVLRADEIERVLRTMQDTVTDRFEVVCSEHNTETGPKLNPILRVEVKSEVNLDDLAIQISDLIRVSSDMTYAQGVHRGRYAPLVCEAYTPSADGKAKRIILA